MILISKFDVKPTQILTWIITGGFVLSLSIKLFVYFSINDLYILILFVFLSILMHKYSYNIWNVWYENGFINIENIYASKKIRIEHFNYIEMTSIFNNNYTIYFKGGDKYEFRIKPTEDLKLFFKNDNQYYAKQLTEQLLKEISKT